MPDNVLTGLLPEAEKALLAGNLPRAEKWCKLHLSSHPDDLAGKVLLGAVFAKSGRQNEAVELLEETVRERDMYEARLILSTIYFSRGDVERALEEGESAIRLDPRELATYNKLGNQLARLGRFEEAITFFRRSIEYGPDDVGSNQNLAAALKDAGRSLESLDAWRNVTLLAPSYGVGWLNYGMLLLASHSYVDALAAAKKAIECDPKSVESLMLGGLSHSELGEAEDAEPYFRRAIQIDPNHPLAQASLGVVLQEQGQFDESTQWLKRSLKHWESNGLAYYVLVRSKKITSSDEPFLQSIRTLLEKDSLSLLDRSYMEYALGKAHEDLKDFETSISHFDRANATAHEFWFSEQPWDKERYRTVIQGTIDTFTKEKLSSMRSSGLASDKPVLIVGMIRSGTTLVEQILSSHPEVAGAGELPFWHEGAGTCLNMREGTVDLQKMEELAHGYLEVLNRFGPEAKRVTDKMPHNYAMLGVIQPALPNARIIHIRRNPLDNCLSVYTTGYSRPPGFTLKRENIVFAYQEYLRLVAHWRETLPSDRFLEIDYEDLVDHRESVTRRMIDFIGLEWDDQCLKHESNIRTVHTPSTWQVRQPIYRTSVERWKNFESWLGEFLELSSGS